MNDQLSIDPNEWLGSRGGSTASYDAGAERVEQYRAEDLASVRRRIMELFRDRKEVHADDVADIPVQQRNVVGIAFRLLADDRIIWSTGEHRRSKMPAAHGRRSYVYRLTEKGERVLNRTL